jgi:hypothetical protein
MDSEFLKTDRKWIIEKYHSEKKALGREVKKPKR